MKILKAGTIRGPWIVGERVALVDATRRNGRPAHIGVYRVECRGCGLLSRRVVDRLTPAHIADSQPRCWRCRFTSPEVTGESDSADDLRPGMLRGATRPQRLVRLLPDGTWECECVGCGRRRAYARRSLLRSQSRGGDSQSGPGCRDCFAGSQAERCPDTCRWCGRTRPEGGSFTRIAECEACARAADRNGRRDCCGAPVRRRSPHVCGEPHRVAEHVARTPEEARARRRSIDRRRRARARGEAT